MDILSFQQASSKYCAQSKKVNKPMKLSVNRNINSKYQTFNKKNQNLEHLSM